MISILIRSKSLLTLLLFAAASTMAGAQEGGIKWRTDYNAARKEATAKNLPILIDFVRPNCYPCEKMEQYTFRDARILATLNEKFIPLRINGAEDTQLVADLKITLFPTLVLAAPEGRITQTLVGFQEADAFHEQLQRLLASLAPTDTMKRDFENAQAWEAAGEFARALNALHRIVDDNAGRPMQKNAQELIQKIEKRADAQLARAKELADKGQAGDALDALNEMIKLYPGVTASKEGADLVSKLMRENTQLVGEQRTKRARELFVQAQSFYKTRDFIPCLDRCEMIIANFGDLPEGQQAFALAAEIKNNPEWLQAAADVMTDRLGGIYLALADSYLKRGEVQRAQFYLRRVVQAFPGSRLAESAQIRLSQLQASVPTPTRPEVQSARP